MGRIPADPDPESRPGEPSRGAVQEDRAGDGIGPTRALSADVAGQTSEIFRNVHVRGTRSRHQDMGHRQLLEHVPGPDITDDVGQQPRPHPSVEGHRMTGTIRIPGTGRIASVLQRQDHPADRRGVDAGLVREEHDGDAHARIGLQRSQARAHGRALPSGVVGIHHDLDGDPPPGRTRAGECRPIRTLRAGEGSPARDGIGDVVRVVPDDHHDAVDPRLHGRIDDVMDQRSPLELRQGLGPTEPRRGSRRQHHGGHLVRRLLFSCHRVVRRTAATTPPREGPVPPTTDASDTVLDRRRTAAVVTASDGVAHGHRTDDSGTAVAALLEDTDFTVLARRSVPDDRDVIAATLRELADSDVGVVVVTGGTGFGPRDITPEATRDVIDREAPGLAEVMRAAGRAKTPMADLSRAVCGIRGRTLIIDLPGSPRGATESLDAVVELLPHALDLLWGDTREHPRGHGDTAAGRPEM